MGEYTLKCRADYVCIIRNLGIICVWQGESASQMCQFVMKGEIAYVDGAMSPTTCTL